MANKHCSICLAPVDGENAPILVMSGAGVARCLCDSCSAELETATAATEYEDIKCAIASISKKLTDNNIDDEITVDTISRILSSAAKRASEIKDGSYDFANDVDADEFFEEIPEDMLESEEDKLLDKEEAERNEKLDKILNWVWAFVLIGVFAFMIWWLFF